MQVHAAEAPRLANTANISFEKLDGEAILFMLDDDRVCVSTGSACEVRIVRCLSCSQSDAGGQPLSE